MSRGKYAIGACIFMMLQKEIGLVLGNSKYQGVAAGQNLISFLQEFNNG